MTNSRIEFIGKCPVNVFSNSKNSKDFSREIAEMKIIQNDDQPFYVMHIGTVIGALEEWFKYLPRIRPFYSLKCNDDPVLVKILASHPDIGFHCITKENLDSALEFVDSNRILYGNHLWTRRSIKNAADNGIGLMSFESKTDLEKININYPEGKLILNISVNPNCEDSRAGFGCSIQDARDIIEYAMDFGINLCGLSFHVGSGCRDPTVFFKAISTCSELFHYGKKHGLKMKYLNIGGGFFNRNINEYSDFASFENICKEINTSLEYFFSNDRYPDIEIIAQPGRFFASNAFCLSTRIISKRTVDLSLITNDNFDSGNEGYVYQINEGFYGSFSCRLMSHCEPKCSPLFSNENDKYTSKQFYGSIIGPTSDEYDIAQSLCHLRQMFIGEWLIWPQMGAYSRNNRGNLGDVDIPLPTVYYYCDENEWRLIESMDSDTSPTASKSINMSIDDDFGSLTDFSDMQSVTDESVVSAEDWMAGWQFQEPVEIFQ